jgi:hypothetical protein
MPRSPFSSETADDTEAGGNTRAWTAEGEYHGSNAQLGCVATIGDWGGHSASIAGRKGKHGQIGRRIATTKRRLDRATVRESHRDILFSMNRVIRGDDESLSPHDSAGRNPSACVNGNDRFPNMLNGGREII